LFAHMELRTDRPRAACRARVLRILTHAHTTTPDNLPRPLFVYITITHMQGALFSIQVYSCSRRAVFFLHRLCPPEAAMIRAIFRQKN
jgi:hypothetical protein